MQTLEQTAPSIIKTLTTSYPDIVAIYAFGSFVTGKTTPSSDLDLALFVKRTL